LIYDPSGWRATRDLGGLDPPTPRAYFASCIFGAGLLVWGGNDSFPGAETESDFHLFDFGLACWVKLVVFGLKKVNGETTLHNVILHRKNHTMTAVLDSRITGMVRNSRLPWIKPQNKLLMK